MDRFQFVTKAKCPTHDRPLCVVITVTDTGDCEMWKGCGDCWGSGRLIGTLKVAANDDKPVNES